MNKQIFFYMCLTAIAVSANAQSGKSCIGFYIGSNFSNFNVTTPDLTAAEKSGYQFGGYYRSGRFLYGQAGLEFQQLKTNLSTDTSSGLVNQKRIQMPLYAGVNMLNFTKSVVNVRAFGGPIFTYNYGYQIDNPDFSSGDFSRVQVNGTIGAAVDVLIFSLDAGYNFGFTNMFSGNFDAHGNYAFVNLGVHF